MDIQENVPLAPITTFKIGGSARYFAEISDSEASLLSHESPLQEVFAFAREKNLSTLILGSASNMLVSDSGFDGLVIHLNTRGFDVLREDKDNITVRVAAGETWDALVERVVASGWWGVENLSLIPGSVGGAPVQNIGAYGQEIADVIDSVHVFDISHNLEKILLPHECDFGYRKSIFNTSERGRYLITNVTLKLKKHGEPNISYPDIKKFFEEKNIFQPTLRQMRESVITIRTRKLADPKEIGNAGSFFKNLTLSEEEYEILQQNVRGHFGEDFGKKLEEIKNRINKISSITIKIPSAFLIDLCGLKGERVGGAKIYEKQPLVIINIDGTATAHDVMSLFKKTRQTIFRLTGMKLVNEPQLVGFSEDELKEYFALGQPLR